MTHPMVLLLTTLITLFAVAIALVIVRAFPGVEGEGQ